MSTLTVTQKTGPIASFEAVSAAADAIAAEGAIPSVRGVTARIGGGSPNTVGLHLRTWREQRPTVEARRQIVVDERIQALLAGQIAEAVSEATKTAAAERDARTEDLAEMEQRASALEAQLEQAETRAAELQERVQHQAGQIEALRAELDAVKADSVASIQQAKTDAAASIQQAKDAAAKQVEEAQAEAANERKKHDEMTRRLGVAEEKAAEVERLRANLAELTATHQKEHGARVDAEKKLAVSEAKASTVESLANQVESLRQNLGRAEIQAAKATAQAEERAAALATLREQMKKAPERATKADQVKPKG